MFVRINKMKWITIELMNDNKVQFYELTNEVKYMYDYMQWSMVRFEMKRLNTTSNL